MSRFIVLESVDYTLPKEGWDYLYMVDASHGALDKAYRCEVEGSKLLVTWNEGEQPQVCHPYTIQDQRNDGDDNHGFCRNV